MRTKVCVMWYPQGILHPDVEEKTSMSIVRDIILKRKTRKYIINIIYSYRGYKNLQMSPLENLVNSNKEKISSNSVS